MRHSVRDRASFSQIKLSFLLNVTYFWCKAFIVCVSVGAPQLPTVELCTPHWLTDLKANDWNDLPNQINSSIHEIANTKITPLMLIFIHHRHRITPARDSNPDSCNGRSPCYALCHEPTGSALLRKIQLFNWHSNGRRVVDLCARAGQMPGRLDSWRKWWRWRWA